MFFLLHGFSGNRVQTLKKFALLLVKKCRNQLKKFRIPDLDHKQLNRIYFSSLSRPISIVEYFTEIKKIHKHLNLRNGYGCCGDLMRQVLNILCVQEVVTHFL